MHHVQPGSFPSNSVRHMLGGGGYGVQSPSFSLRRLVTGAVASLAIGCGAMAVPVPIANHSFEDGVVPFGSSAPGATGWTHTGSFGRFGGSGVAGQAAAPTDGNQIAYFHVGNADARQDLTDTYQAGGDYLFSVDISAREPLVVTKDMSLILYAGGNPNNVIAKRTLNGTIVPADVFNTFSFTLSAAEAQARGAVGQTIGVRFASHNDEAAGGDFDLDNVRLELTPAPPGPAPTLTAVPIVNGSFEDAVVAPGTAANGATGWTSSGTASGFGRFRGAGNFGQLAAPTDGDQIAFFNVGNADVSQVLAATYAAGSDYLLLLDISARDQLSATQDMDIILFANGDPNNIVALLTLTGPEVPNDVFLPYSLTATAADILAAGALGQSIGIRFSSQNDGGGGDFDLDNVRLFQVTAAVPEPATASLALLALASMATRRRRQGA